MAADSFLRLLQFSDGLFPAGGYAHSFGLETLAQSGRVQNEADVAAFLRTYLESSAAPTDAVAALCARKYALAGDLQAALRLDSLLDALKAAAELRDASGQMGRQTLRILRALHAPTPSPNVVMALRQGTASAVPNQPVEQGASAPEVPFRQGTASAVPNQPVEQGASAPEAFSSGSDEAAVALGANRLLVGRGFSRDISVEPPPGASAPEAFSSGSDEAAVALGANRLLVGRGFRCDISLEPPPGASAPTPSNHGVIPSEADAPLQRFEGASFGGVEGSALPFAEAELSLRDIIALGSAAPAPEVPLRQGTASAVPDRPLEQGASAPGEHLAAFIGRYAVAVETSATPGHHPVVFGLAGAAFDWPARETASAFLYTGSAMIVGAALRLLPLGQLAGQRILAGAGSLIGALAESILDKNESDMHSFAPELEIAAMRHEALDARLFRS